MSVLDELSWGQTRVPVNVLQHLVEFVCNACYGTSFVSNDPLELGVCKESSADFEGHFGDAAAMSNVVVGRSVGRRGGEGRDATVAFC